MPQTESLSLSLKQAAIKARHYARQYIIQSSSQLKYNNYEAFEKFAVKKGIDDIAASYTYISPYVLEKDDMIWLFYSCIEATKKFSGGNCFEATILALEYIVENTPHIKAEICELMGGDHVFLVLGRQEGSDPVNPMTWGDAYVCDAWLEFEEGVPQEEIGVYKASDYLFRLKNLGHTVIEEANSHLYSAYLENFDKTRHCPSFIPKSNTDHIRQATSTEHLKKITQHFHEKLSGLRDSMKELITKLDILLRKLIKEHGKEDGKAQVISELMTNLQSALSNLDKEKETLTLPDDYKEMRQKLESLLEKQLQTYIQATQLTPQQNSTLVQFRNQSSKTQCMQFFKIPSGTAKYTKDALDDTNQRIASFFTAPKLTPFRYSLDEATKAFIREHQSLK